MQKPSGTRRLRVAFEAEARADLFELYRAIHEHADRLVAGADIDRIEAACMALASSPKRGARRDDLRPGLRTVGCERRATIAYHVEGAEVVIDRIFCGGRDCERVLRGPADA